MSNASQQKAEIIAVERAWVAAHLDLDLDTLDDILSDQYLQIQADGEVIGKQELLASYRSGQRKWEIAESDQHAIRLLGEVALLLGRWRGKGTNQGVSFDYTARFLAVYHLEGENWKLVSDVSIAIDGN